MISQSITADLSKPIGTINPMLHGHFVEQLASCITNGLWDAKNDCWNQRAVELLRDLGTVLMRWPGGCFADMYHWQDGIGNPAIRPRRLTSRWGWDDEEDNRVGTHEFIDLCQQTGAKAWINGNVATGTVQEMVDWVEYCCYSGDATLTRQRKQNGQEAPFEIPFWGIGNECWDCGGLFTPTEYADIYRRYESSLPKRAAHPLNLIVCGPDGNKPLERKKWTQEVLQRLFDWRRPRIYAVDAHWYNWGDEKGTGTSTEFTADQTKELFWRALDIETMILEQLEVIHSFDPNIKLIIGEWGTWHPDAWKNRFYQEVTIRDGAIASAQIDIFHRNCNHISAATMTQSCNILSAPLNIIDGAVFPTPTYFALLMQKPHRGQTAVETTIESDAINYTHENQSKVYARFSTTVSRDGNRFAVTITNLNPENEETLEFQLKEGTFTPIESKLFAGESLDTRNTIDRPDLLKVIDANLPTIETKALKITIPPAGILSFVGTLN